MHSAEKLPPSEGGIGPCRRAWRLAGAPRVMPPSPLRSARSPSFRVFTLSVAPLRNGGRTRCSMRGATPGFGDSILRFAKIAEAIFVHCAPLGLFYACAAKGVTFAASVSRALSGVAS
jgi:hypothetical protein